MGCIEGRKVERPSDAGGSTGGRGCVVVPESLSLAEPAPSADRVSKSAGHSAERTYVGYGDGILERLGHIPLVPTVVTGAGRCEAGTG